MRVFLGIILGIALTISGAYFIDHWGANANASATTTVVERPIVNWDVAEGRWLSLRSELQELSANVQRGWHKLVG
jgi:hypothetical protein